MWGWWRQTFTHPTSSPNFWFEFSLRRSCCTLSSFGLSLLTYSGPSVVTYQFPQSKLFFCTSHFIYAHSCTLPRIYAGAH